MTQGRVVVAVLIGIAGMACESSTRSSDGGLIKDAPATGGDAIGTGGLGEGSGGSIGIGGSASGSVPATGGVAGSATGGAHATGGDGGAVDLDPMEICRDALRAQAERMATCLGLDTVDSYMRTANACPEYVFNADSNRDVQTVADCLPALRARTCTDVALVLMPECYPNGKLDGGQRCAFSSQCKSGSCNSDGKGCGVCADGSKPAGSACQLWYECAVGLHCNGSQCIENSTATYADEGQPCDLKATPLVGCVGDLYCKISAASGPGTCVSAPGAGEPCAGDGSPDYMLSTAVCASGTTCVQGTCQPPGGCGVDMQCDSISYCAASGSDLSCAPRALAGQECSVGTAGVPCLAPAVCLDHTKCVVPRALGEACDADNPCDRYLTCDAGTCKGMVAATCSP